MLAFLKRSWGNPAQHEEVPPLSEAARARQEVLRGLLRTAARPGDEEYEAMLARVYALATALCEDLDQVSRTGHRLESARAGWEAIGFQAAAPDREFRGGGTLGLHCLTYVLEHRRELCASLVRGPFPFAAASINMTLVVARLAGVVEEGDDVAVDPLETDRRRVSEARAQHLLASSHDGFFELHAAALEALDRACRDLDAGPMDFAGCADAARDEVAVLLAHEPTSSSALRALVDAVPRRTAGFLDAMALPDDRRRRTKLRCWMTLSTGVLRWYPPHAVHSHGDARSATAFGDPDGSFKLTKGMTVKFNQRSASLSVYRDDDDLVLHALANDDGDLERWCVSLTEHIALASVVPRGLLAKATAVKATLDSETFPTSTRFKVVESIGIYVRSAPDVAATRTGKALMPGDIVAVLERRRVHDPSAGHRGRAFLRCHISGQPESWVMEHHPTTYEPILIQVVDGEPTHQS